MFSPVGLRSVMEAGVHVLYSAMIVMRYAPLCPGFVPVIIRVSSMHLRGLGWMRLGIAWHDGSGSRLKRYN